MNNFAEKEVEAHREYIKMRIDKELLKSHFNTAMEPMLTVYDVNQINMIHKSRFERLIKECKSKEELDELHKKLTTRRPRSSR